MLLCGNVANLDNCELCRKYGQHARFHTNLKNKVKKYSFSIN